MIDVFSGPWLAKHCEILFTHPPPHYCLYMVCLLPNRGILDWVRPLLSARWPSNPKFVHLLCRRPFRACVPKAEGLETLHDKVSERSSPYAGSRPRARSARAHPYGRWNSQGYMCLFKLHFYIHCSPVQTPSYREEIAETAGLDHQRHDFWIQMVGHSIYSHPLTSHDQNYENRTPMP